MNEINYIGNTFIGIDPSLKGNAVVIINKDGNIIQDHLISTDTECYLNPEQRILDIFSQLDYITETPGLVKIYIEGLAYSTTSSTLFERCGLLYMLITTFFKMDIPYSVIPPPQLKKWHTTDGRAKKDLMMCVAKCKWGIDFKDDNICDAYCLAMMAREDHKNNIRRN